MMPGEEQEKRKPFNGLDMETASVEELLTAPSQSDDILAIANTPGETLGPQIDPLREKPSPNPISEFAAGFHQGLYNIKGTVEGTAGLIAGTGILGQGYEDAAGMALENAQTTFDKGAAVGPEIKSMGDIDSALDVANWAAGLIGNMAPEVLGTGIIGKVGSVAAKRAVEAGIKRAVIAEVEALGSTMSREAAERAVASKLATQLAKPEVIDRINRAATAAFTVPNVAYGTAREGTGIGLDIYEKTGEVEPGTALLYGAPAGALDAFGSIIFERKLFNVGDMGKPATSRARAIGRGAWQGAVGEAPVESAQQVLGILPGKIAAGEDWTWEDTKQVIEAGVGGGLVGGILGGAGGIRTPVAPKTDKPERDVTPDDVKDEKPVAAARAQTQGDMKVAEAVAGASDRAEAVEQKTGAPTSATREAAQRLTEEKIRKSAKETEATIEAEVAKRREKLAQEAQAGAQVDLGGFNPETGNLSYSTDDSDALLAAKLKAIEGAKGKVQGEQVIALQKAATDIQSVLDSRRGKAESKPVTVPAPKDPREVYRLPASLSGSKPRYKGLELDWESDYDKAAYTLAADENKRSKHADKFEKSLEVAGLDVNEVKAHGKRIREYIKGLADTTPAGRVKIPRQSFQAAPAIDTATATPSPTGPVPAATRSEMSDTSAATDRPMVELPISNLDPSPDVPQFKKGADPKTGVVQPLQGKYQRDPKQPIMVWQRKDGKHEVVSGRHRLELAKRSGETTIPAQVWREDEGFTAKDMAFLDASANIRDEQGSITDYATFIKQSGLDEAGAQEAGLLSRPKGRAGFEIGRLGSDALYDSLRNGAITETQAAAIAKAAPNDEATQRTLMARNIPADQVANWATLLKKEKSEAGIEEQGDLFGSNDASLNRLDRITKAAAQRSSEIGKDIKALMDRRKDPALSAKHGIDLNDPMAVTAKIEELRATQAKLNDLGNNPDIVESLDVETEKKVPETVKVLQQKAAEVKRDVTLTPQEAKDNPPPESVTRSVKQAPKKATPKTRAKVETAPESGAQLPFTQMLQLAKDPATPISVFEGWAASTDPGVRVMATARFSELSAETQASLLKDESDSVRLRAEEKAKASPKAEVSPASENVAVDEEQVVKEGLSFMASVSKLLGIEVDTDYSKIKDANGIREAAAKLAQIYTAADKLHTEMSDKADAETTAELGERTEENADSWDEMAGQKYQAISEAKAAEAGLPPGSSFTPGTPTTTGYYALEQRSKELQEKAPVAISDKPKYDQLTEKIKALREKVTAEDGYKALDKIRKLEKERDGLVTYSDEFKALSETSSSGDLWWTSFKEAGISEPGTEVEQETATQKQEEPPTQKQEEPATQKQEEPATQEPAEGPIPSKLSPDLAQQLLENNAGWGGIFPVGNQTQRLRSLVMRALTGKSKVSNEESRPPAVKAALIAEFGSEAAVEAALKKLAVQKPLSIRKTPTTGKGKAHFEKIKAVIENLKARFPGRKIRVVESIKDTPRNALAAIGNISKGKLKALGIEDSLPSQHVLGTFPNTFAGISNAKQFSEAVASLLPAIRQDIKNGKFLNTGFNEAPYEARLGRPLTDSERKTALDEMRSKQQTLQNNWVDYLETGGYTPEVQALILGTITKEIAEPTADGKWKFRELGKNSERLPDAASPELAARVAERLTQPDHKNKRIAQIIAESAQEAEQSRRSDKEQVATTTEDGGSITWVRFPSKENDPENFDKNVQDLTSLAKTSAKFGKCSWCTGDGAAQGQLSNGDFWIGVDENGNARTAIRMEGDEIGEIRGVLEGQNLEPKYAGNVSQFVKEQEMEGGTEFLADAKIQGALQQFENGEIDFEELKKTLGVPRDHLGRPLATSNAQYIQTLIEHRTQGYGNKDLPFGPKLWEGIESEVGNLDVTILEKLAERTDATGGVLSKIVDLQETTDQKHFIGRAIYDVARNKNTPQETLWELAKHEELDVRQGAAGNTNSPPQALRRLAGDKGCVLIVAENTSTPGVVLQKLSESKAVQVVRTVAANPSANPELLRQLATHPETAVRYAVSRNKNVSPEILRDLSKDHWIGIRLSVAENKNTPPEVLAELSNESGDRVGEVDGFDVKKAVSSNPSTPTEALERMLREEPDPDFELARNIAANTNTKPETLDWLAQFGSALPNLVVNPNTPTKTLERLAKDYKGNYIGHRAQAELARRQAAGEIPAGAQAALDPDANVEAYYDLETGEMVIITDNVRDEARAAQLFFHEATHGNVAKLEGTPESKAALDDILARAEKPLNDAIPQILEESGYGSLEELAKAYGFDLTTPEGKRQMQGELVARFAERIADNPNPPVWWKALLRDLSLWFKNYFGININAADLEHFLRKQMMAPPAPGNTTKTTKAQIMPSKTAIAEAWFSADLQKTGLDELSDLLDVLYKMSRRDERAENLLNLVNKELERRAYLADMPDKGGTVTIDLDWMRRAATNADGSINAKMAVRILIERLSNGGVYLQKGAKPARILTAYGDKILIDDGTEIDATMTLLNGDTILVEGKPKAEETETQNQNQETENQETEETEDEARASTVPNLNGRKWDDEPTPDAKDWAQALLFNKILPYFGVHQKGTQYKRGGFFGSGKADTDVKELFNAKDSFRTAWARKAEFVSKRLDEALKKWAPNGTKDGTRLLNTALGNILQAVSAEQQRAAELEGRVQARLAQERWISDNLGSEQDMIDNTILEQFMAATTAAERTRILDSALSNEQKVEFLRATRTAETEAVKNSLAAFRQANINDAKAARAEALGKLPKDLADALIEMSSQIQELSAYGLSKKLIDESVALGFGSDGGIVLTRTYKMFDKDMRKDWKAKVSRDDATQWIRDNLTNWVHTSLISGKARELRAARARAGIDLSMEEAQVQAIPLVKEDDVQKMVDEIVNAPSERMGTTTLEQIMGGTVKDLGIPKEVADAWGVYTSPQANFARSLWDMSSRISHAELMRNILQFGTEQGWLRKDPAGLPDGYKRIQTESKEDTLLKHVKELEGLYAPELFVDFLREYYSHPEKNAFLETMAKISLATTLMKTTQSPTGAIRNFVSNTLPAMTVGDLSAIFGNGSAFRGAWKSMRGKGPKDLEAYIFKLTKLGVLGDNVGPQLIKDIYNKARYMTDEQLEASMAQEMFGKAKTVQQAGAKYFETTGRVYGMMDEIWKINAFQSGIKKIKAHEDWKKENTKNYVPMTESQIEEAAAARVRKYYPTYSRAADFVKKLKVAPFLGQFATFSSEIMRTNGNILIDASNDIRNGDDFQKKEASKTLARFAVAMSIPAALGMVGKALLGVSDEEEEAVRESLAPWQKNSQIVFLSRGENGKLRYLDLSYVDPYSVLKEPFIAAMGELDGKPANIPAALGTGLVSWVSPFLKLDISSNLAMEVAANKKTGGGRVYNPEDPDWAWDVLGHMSKGFSPGFYTTASNVASGFTGESKTGLVGELFGAVGFRSQVSDPVESLKWAGIRSNTRLKDANNILLKDLRSGGDIQGSFVDANEARYEILKDLWQQYNAGIKRGGNRKELDAMLEQGAGSKDLADQIRHGYITPYKPGKATLKQIDKEGLSALKEAAKDSKRRYFE